MGTEKMDDEISMDPSLLLPEKVVKLSQALSEGLNAIRTYLQGILDDIYEKTGKKSEENVLKHGNLTGNSSGEGIRLKPSIFVFDGNTKRIVFALAPKMGVLKEEVQWFKEMQMGYLGVTYPFAEENETRSSNNLNKSLDLLNEAIESRATIFAVNPFPEDENNEESVINKYFLNRRFRKAYVHKKGEIRRYRDEDENNSAKSFVIAYPEPVFKTDKSKNQLKKITGVAIMARKYELPGKHPPVICATVCTIRDPMLKNPKDDDSELMAEGGLFDTLIEQIDYYGSFLQITGYQLSNYAFGAAKGNHLERLALSELLELYNDRNNPVIVDIPIQFQHYPPTLRKLLWASLKYDRFDIKKISESLTNKKTRERDLEEKRVRSDIELISCNEIADALVEEIVDLGFNRIDSSFEFPAAWFGDHLARIETKRANDIFCRYVGKVLFEQKNQKSQNYPSLLRDLWQTGMMIASSRDIDCLVENKKLELCNFLERLLLAQTSENLIEDMLEQAFLSANIIDPFILKKILEIDPKLYERNRTTPIIRDCFVRLEGALNRIDRSNKNMVNKTNSEWCRPIVVTSQKGGVGKTTVAANLAKLLSELKDNNNLEILLIELDICGPTYGFWDDISDDGSLTTQGLIYHISSGLDIEAGRIRHWPKNESCNCDKGFDIVMASTKRSDQDAYRYNMANYVQNIINFISEDSFFKNKYRFVILDCPAEYQEIVFRCASLVRTRNGAIVHVAEPSLHTIIPTFEASLCYFFGMRQYLLVNKVGYLDLPVFKNNDTCSHFLSSTKRGLGSFRTNMASIIRRINQCGSEFFIMPYKPSLGNIHSMREITDSRNYNFKGALPLSEEVGLKAMAEHIILNDI